METTFLTKSLIVLAQNNHKVMGGVLSTNVFFSTELCHRCLGRKIVLMTSLNSWNSVISGGKICKFILKVAHARSNMAG